jgi:hypothetical protein
MSEYDVLRDDHTNLVINEAAAEMLAEKMATRFHAVAQKLQGGVLQGVQGQPTSNPATANQTGGKGVIKFNPSVNEIQQGIRQEITLLSWQSPDGLPKYVTIEVGRLVSGVGGPGADGTKGGLVFVNSVSSAGVGSVGGASWPAGLDASNNPLYYRGVAQILLGTPGTMQDQFWIDINRGQRFTTCASSVSVTAQMRSPPVDARDGGTVVPPLGQGNPYISGSMLVYATLTPYVAPTLMPVLYTQYIDMGGRVVSGFTGSIDFIIPPRANLLFPTLTSAVGQSFQYRFYDNIGNTIENPPVEVMGTRTSPIVLPADCFGVQFTTTNAAVAFNGRLIYQLSL